MTEGLRLRWERFKLAVVENWLRLRGVPGCFEADND